MQVDLDYQKSLSLSLHLYPDVYSSQELSLEAKT